MKPTIQSVKGTREFYPEDMALRNWLYSKIGSVARRFGYQEYDGPFLETLELYAAKSGEELVKEQSFVFPDRGGNLITLRPELTLSLARMVSQKQNELIFPLRWWSFGPFWRYEKPQKGRSREFFQWNADLVGVNSIESDAEVIAIAAEFFKEVGLNPSEVKILVNDRQLMGEQLAAIGISDADRPKVLGFIDRIDKMNRSSWRAFVIENGLSESQADNLQRILENPDIYKESEKLIRLFELLTALNVRDYIKFDARIVRGLDYYTGVVFEARDIGEQSRAILGGGRYDNLVEAVGGQPLAGVGFAMGDVVIANVLQEMGKLPNFEVNPAPVLLTIFDTSTLPDSFALAARLRSQRINALVYPEAVKLGKQFKFADRVGVKFVLTLGPEEIGKGIVQIKNMVSGDQICKSIEEAASFLKVELAG